MIRKYMATWASKPCKIGEPFARAAWQRFARREPVMTWVQGGTDAAEADIAAGRTGTVPLSP